MKILKTIISIIILCSATNLEAQSIERSTFDVAGGVAKTDQFEVHYSLGQSFVKTVDLADITVSEGFIQGSIEEISTATEYYPHVNVEIFPNPSFDWIRISSDEYIPDSKLQLFDLHGRILLEQKFDSKQALDISRFSSGNYFLKWIDRGQRIVRQFKLIKL